jgi:hypothetical protein
MTQQKQTALSNWLLGLATVAATGSFGFAWNTNTRITILIERDREKTEQISVLQQKVNDIQIGEFSIKDRLSDLEEKIKIK